MQTWGVSVDATMEFVTNMAGLLDLNKCFVASLMVSTLQVILVNSRTSPSHIRRSWWSPSEPYRCWRNFHRCFKSSCTPALSRIIRIEGDPAANRSQRGPAEHLLASRARLETAWENLTAYPEDQAQAKRRCVLPLLSLSLWLFLFRREGVYCGDVCK